MDLPLNALRAFEGSARHLNFTRAAEELQLSSTAISQHVNNLEQRLDVPLFRRVRRGLTLTDEGLALLPLLTEAFGRIAASIEGFRRGRGTRLREVLSVGAVGTFAVGWLLPHLCEFKREQPWVDLRIFTNNNRVDLAGEVLDFTVQFGDGHWHGTEALPLITAAFVPQRRMDRVVRRRRPHPADRAWGDPRLVARDGGGCGARRGRGAAAHRDVRARPAQRPAGAQVATEIDAGRYWLTRLKSRRETPAMRAFRDWLVIRCGKAGDAANT